MLALSTTNKKLVEDIINKGYANAAKSFSTLTGQEVTLETTAFEYGNSNEYLRKKFGHLAKLTILQTNIVGIFNGVSYLILTKEDREAVASMSLSAFGNPKDIDEETVLKEVDNIIAASMITELSNALEASIYGDVPHFFEVDNIEVLNKKLDQPTNSHLLLAHTHFLFEGQVTNPIFIWQFNNELLDLLS